MTRDEMLRLHNTATEVSKMTSIASTGLGSINLSQILDLVSDLLQVVKKHHEVDKVPLDLTDVRKEHLEGQMPPKSPQAVQGNQEPARTPNIHTPDPVQNKPNDPNKPAPTELTIK